MWITQSVYILPLLSIVGTLSVESHMKFVYPAPNRVLRGCRFLSSTFADDVLVYDQQ